MYKDWLASQEELREGLRDYLMDQPQSLAQLSRAIPVNALVLSRFINGKQGLGLPSRIKVMKFLEKHQDEEDTKK